MERKQPFMFFPTVTSRIIVGILTFTGIVIMIFWVAINEPGRMEEFTQRSEGRKIETGATLFESNCSSCHGQQGYGIAGVAPALNNPQLFGYNWFEAIDNRIAAIDAVLETEEDEAEIAKLDTEREKLGYERTQLKDDLIYNYSEMLADVEGQYEALGNKVEEAGFTPDRLGFEVNTLQTQIDELNAELEGTEETTGIDAQIKAAEDEGETPDQDLVDRRDEINAQLEALNTQIAPLKGFDRELSGLIGVRANLNALMDAHTAIDQTYTSIISLYDNALENGTEVDQGSVKALQLVIDNNSQARETAYTALLEASTIVAYDPEAPSRMSVLKWSGSLFDLIYTTLVAGRPTSASYWPNPMAAWSQSAGGPLRNDELRSLAEYVLNFHPEGHEFTREDVRKINQFAKIPQEGGGTAIDASDAVGTDVPSIVAQLQELQGDPNSGQSLYTSNGCGGCHTGGIVGPDPAELAANAQARVDADAATYPDPLHYIVESIVDPEAYIVEGRAGGLMPATFGTTLTPQNLADIIAYLESFN